MVQSVSIECSKKCDPCPIMHGGSSAYVHEGVVVFPLYADLAIRRLLFGEDSDFFPSLNDRFVPLAFVLISSL